MVDGKRTGEPAGSKAHTGSLLHPAARHAGPQLSQPCQHRSGVARVGSTPPISVCVTGRTGTTEAGRGLCQRVRDAG